MGDVIQFVPRPKPPPKRITGVFIRPCYSPTTIFMLDGNLTGWLDSYTAFHPDFDPNIIRRNI